MSNYNDDPTPAQFDKMKEQQTKDAGLDTPLDTTPLEVKLIKEKETEIETLKSNIKLREEDLEKYKLTNRQRWDVSKCYSKKDMRKLRKKPELSYIVTMLYPNRTSKDFVVVGERKTFNYQKRTFILNIKEGSWYDLTMNQYHLYYFFNEAEPITNKMHPLPNIVYTGVEKGHESFLAVKSDNAQEVLEQEYVRILASANQLNLWLKINLILCVFNAFFSMVMMLLMFLVMRNISVIVKVLKGG